ncbi:MAG TPA: cytochrome c oxidase subunit II [Ignavibacteria bacterium]|nr:cytochrome c oxidase subunit II [Ignavibacteria bacterium]
MRPNIVDQVDFTFWFIMGISIVLLVIITVVMLYFVYKYNRKRHPVPENIEGNTTVEVIWTVIPLILVLIMFFISWGGFKNMRDVPADAMVVSVTGQMWKWSFEYDNKKKSDTLFLPANKNVKFEIKSVDVNHSFFLPAFRTKEDAIPGRVNYYWIRTDEPATYYAACAEYCGLSHSNMYAPVIVIPEEKFLVWKNYFPPDTSKKETPVIKTDSLKTDTLKTTVSKTDSLKPNSVKTDSLKPNKVKTDTLKSTK